MSYSASMTGRLVFINQATGYLTIDIINEFSNNYKDIVLITGSIRVQNRPLNPDVKVKYIIRYDRGNNFRKALSWFIGTIQIYFLLKFRYEDYEKFFFTIPPPAYLLSPNLKSAFSILIYDLYPEALKAYGLIEEGIIYRWWSEKNKKVFSKSHIIYTLSENMKSQILSYSGTAIVKVIPNWSAFSGLLPVRKEQNSIIKNEGLTGKFVVQYSGNIGVTHNVDTIIEVAESLSGYSDIVFQVIGRGEKSKAIRKLVGDKRLKNCKLLPFRSDDLLYESLCAADLAIITLDNKTSDISVPSKLYNIMAAGLPVMAIAPLNSAISEIISQNKIGKTFEKDNLRGMCEYIIELKNNPSLRLCLSEHSFSASRNFTRSNANKYFQYYNEVKSEFRL